ncbi:MAG: hypothetical protein ABW104_08620 [Candidatus Thiodiazotropha sp. 6PLUC2]
MNIVRDDETYDSNQVVMLKNIVASFKRILELNGVDEEMIYSISSDLAFDVCSIIDGSTVMGNERAPVIPFLTFCKNEEEKEMLIINDNGSYMHEMTHDMIDKIFEID